jgi:hypothetical protein
MAVTLVVMVDAVDTPQAGAEFHSLEQKCLIGV